MFSYGNANLGNFVFVRRYSMPKNRSLHTDAQCEHIRPFIPKCTSSSKGGRPSADDRKCFEGILWGSIPLIASRAYDSNPHRERLKQSNCELICPHHKSRKRAGTQDGRKLRRYRRRSTIERIFAWLGTFRRLLVRHEFYVIMYNAFMHFACAMICIRRFCNHF